MSSISVIELNEKLNKGGDNMQIIDVRTVWEWQQARIDDKRVKHIDLNDLDRNISKIDLDKEIYLICNSGSRSAIAQQALNEAGINSTNVTGGMQSWLLAGLSTARG